MTLRATSTQPFSSQRASRHTDAKQLVIFARAERLRIRVRGMASVHCKLPSPRVTADNPITVER